MLNSRSFFNGRPKWFAGGRLFRLYYFALLILRLPLAREYSCSPDKVKVFLITRDLYSCLNSTVNCCLRAGIRAENIFILDQGSSSVYCKAALATLAEKGLNVVRVPMSAEKYGPYVLWKSEELSHLVRSLDYPYIVTDSDLQFPDSCPPDWLDKMFYRLNKHRYILKVSFSLRVNDINTSNRMEVLQHEHKLGESVFYRFLNYLALNKTSDRFCQTDTTFSLYRPKLDFSTISCRLDFPYELIHLPWYKNFESTEEYQYYRSRKNKNYGMWS